MLFRIALRPFRHRAPAATALRAQAQGRFSTIQDQIITMSKTDHAQRTAAEPRDPSLHKVTLACVEEINPTIRTFRLAISASASGIKFLPGQWLDVYVPGIDKPGGFTITSPPSKAFNSNNNAAVIDQLSSSQNTTDAPSPYLELAVQKSPDNVVAKWLWQPMPSILSSELRVRVGGSFVWPPPGILLTTLRKIVFVAGGVGINPLISILSHLAERSLPTNTTIHFLYSTRDPGQGQRDPRKILFLNRLAGIFDNGKEGGVRGELKLFLTPSRSGSSSDGEHEKGQFDEINLPFLRRRMIIEDVAGIIGADKRDSVVYLCGLPTMTDEFVEKLTSAGGLSLEPHRVLYEKWW